MSNQLLALSAVAPVLLFTPLLGTMAQCEGDTSGNPCEPNPCYSAWVSHAHQMELEATRVVLVQRAWLETASTAIPTHITAIQIHVTVESHARSKALEVTLAAHIQRVCWGMVPSAILTLVLIPTCATLEFLVTLMEMVLSFVDLVLQA